MGTEVIKIEHPTIGERGAEDRCICQEVNPAFSLKPIKVVILPCTSRWTKDSEILYKLVKDSDIFVENFRPNVTKHLGNLC